MAMEANEVKSEDQPGGRTGDADCERASEYVASPAVHVASAMQGLEDLGVIVLDDECREAASTILHELCLAGVAATRREERRRIAAAERVSCRYAHAPGTGDARPKVVLIVREANGRRESIALSPEHLHVDDRDRIAQAEQRGAVRALREAADRFERDANEAKLGQAFQGGPLHDASVYNVNAYAADRLRALAVEAAAPQGEPVGGRDV